MATPGADATSLRESLRGVGLRATAPRVAVLRQLVTATDPVSHAELAETLSDDGFDRATIYRNLIDLTNAGLARRFDAGDHTWRFELSVRGAVHEGHAHFVCVDCGAVQCLPHDAVQVDGGPRAMVQQSVEIQVRGRCDDCFD